MQNYDSIDIISGDGFVEVKHRLVSKGVFIDLLLKYYEVRKINFDMILAIGHGESNLSVFQKLNNLKQDKKQPLLAEVFIIFKKG